jgi:hypothetical protein
MRRAQPLVDILLHCNDLDAAFRRVLYHPDMAVVFAYIFADYLIIQWAKFLDLAVHRPISISCPTFAKKLLLRSI